MVEREALNLSFRVFCFVSVIDPKKSVRLPFFYLDESKQIIYICTNMLAD